MTLELIEYPVAEFSVGALLGPRRWTLDAQSHSTPWSAPRQGGSTTTEDVEAMNQNRFASRNIARFEALERTGDAIYIAEIFTPRSSSCSSSSPLDDADSQADALRRVLPRRPDRPPLQAWAVELCRESAVPGFLHDASVAATLWPTHRIYIQVALDVFDGASSAMVKVAQRLLDDTVGRYYRAPMKLPDPKGYFFTEALLSKRAAAVLRVKSENADEQRCRWNTVGTDCAGDAVVALQDLIKQHLRLQDEDLYMTLSSSSSSDSSRVDSVSVVAVATVPLHASTTSIFNYLSVEQTLERHLETSLASSTAHYEFSKFASSERFVPTEEFVQAVESEEDAPVVIPPRTSHYAVIPPCGGTHAPTTAFVLQLMAPRVQSSNAIVLVATVQLHNSNNNSTREDVLAECRVAAQRLRLQFSMEYLSPRTWTPLCLAGAGSLFLQGELALRLPAGDRRYCSAQVMPTCASFSSLGSLTVSSCLENALASEAPQPLFSSLAAVWTLLADGREASDYIDYVLSEYQYDLQVKHLGNVAQRTTATSTSDVIQVRRRVQHKSGRNSGAAEADKKLFRQQLVAIASKFGTVTSSDNSWSAWIDLLHARRRIFIWVRGSGVGRLLVCQAIVEGPADDGQEEEVEAWVRDVGVGAKPQF